MYKRGSFPQGQVTSLYEFIQEVYTRLYRYLHGCHVTRTLQLWKPPPIHCHVKAFPSLGLLWWKWPGSWKTLMVVDSNFFCISNSWSRSPFGVFWFFFFYKKEKKKKIPKLNLLVFYKINMLSLRICCEINTTIIGKNTIFLNKFFSFVYKSKHLHSKEEPHTHFTQLYSSAYQCRERNVLSVRPPRWATDNRTSKGLCLWLLKNNLSVLLDCYTEVNQLLQDTFQPTFQTTNTRDCNRDSTG